ncbi:MAG: NlpC/P60 family protein, partial [Actinomycetia bacterium]|nr:NlpC/P60 family protein [Actinomycetes bacterium]
MTAKLDTLAKQNEALTEQYNRAKIEVADTRKAADAAQLAAVKATHDLAAAQEALDATLAAQYEGDTISPASALLTSTDSQDYLDTLSYAAQLREYQASVVTTVQQAEKKSKQANQKAKELLAKARQQLASVSKQRDTIIAETGKYRTLLATLTAAERAALARRNAVATTPAQVAKLRPNLPTVHAGSAAAQRAVDFALKQVGKAYAFAAAGPDAFDCSGLTMAAWAQGGVSLPHSAAAQYAYGTHVPLDQLQPGDLVFLYSPISHVEIYIGNGNVVSAADEA